MRKEITKKKCCTAPSNDICRASCADICKGQTLMGANCLLYRQVKVSKNYKSIQIRYSSDGAKCDWGEDD